jgi:hypothetical protein
MASQIKTKSDFSNCLLGTVTRQQCIFDPYSETGHSSRNDIEAKGDHTRLNQLRNNLEKDF